MALEALQLRVPIRKLLIGTLVTVIPICLAGLYTIAQSSRSMRNIIGSHFATIANSSASEISVFVHQCVQQAALMAADSAVLDAVNAANRGYAGMTDAAIKSRALGNEQIWNKPEGARLVEQMLGSPASRQLRRFRELNAQFLRLTLTDQYGGTVAASHKTVDFWQADEDFWQNIHAQGRGAVSLTDILYDEITKANYIGVGIPIVDRESGKFLGALDALVDVSTVFPIINRVRLGETGRLQMVRDDGTIIGAPEVSLPMKLKSEEFAALKDAVRETEIQNSGWVLTELRGGSFLIGYADTRLKHDYRMPGSVVLLVQDSGEAFASVRTVERLLALMALLGLATATFLAVYFSIHRHVTYTDISAVKEQPLQKTTAP
jgi:hypothetical protein